MDAATDKDLPLKEDTRLLGRVLGDVLRAQNELAVLLNPLPVADVLHVVRAFSYFSHLANIAEDVHQNRRRRVHALAGSPPQRGSVAQALERLAAAGIDGA